MSEQQCQRQSQFLSNSVERGCYDVGTLREQVAGLEDEKKALQGQIVGLELQVQMEQEKAASAAGRHELLLLLFRCSVCLCAPLCLCPSLCLCLFMSVYVCASMSVHVCVSVSLCLWLSALYSLS